MHGVTEYQLRHTAVIWESTKWTVFDKNGLNEVAMDLGRLRKGHLITEQQLDTHGGSTGPGFIVDGQAIRSKDAIYILKIGLQHHLVQFVSVLAFEQTVVRISNIYIGPTVTVVSQPKVSVSRSIESISKSTKATAFPTKRRCNLPAMNNRNLDTDQLIWT
jgi:hypothetical protein